MFAYEILERFLNPGVQCESRSSLAQSAILKYNWSKIWRDCWPCMLKFSMADMSKYVITLDHNIFGVYKLISHDIFILMFYNSLEQCKNSVGCSCCTRVSRNHLFFQFFPQNFWITKVGWCKIRDPSWAYLWTHLVIPKGLMKKGKFQGGGGLNDYGILTAWGVTHFGISEGKGS